MDAYVFDIFISHSIVLEDMDEDRMFTTTCDLIEIGPVNISNLNNLMKIKEIVRDMSLTPIASNWWTDFSTWKDFYGIL